jgi:hypothetical protein
MASDKHLEQAIHEARQRLGDALRQRDQLNVTIIQLESQVKAIEAALIRDSLVKKRRQTEQSAVGLTEAIRTVLRLSGKPMPAAEVKNTLTVMGFDFSNFSNPSAAVHSTLKRMVSAGELSYLGAKTYRLPNAFYGEGPASRPVK